MKKNIDPEDLPTRVSTSKVRNFGWDSKEPRKYDGAMFNKGRRYFVSMVGYEWDYVWADICRHHNDVKKDELRKFVRDKIDWFVEKNVKIAEDGKLLCSDRSCRIYSAFYIHPLSETLELAPKEPKYRRVDHLPKPIKIDGKFYGLIDGLWYELKLEKWVKTHYHFQDPMDIFFGRYITPHLSKRYGEDANLYCYDKRAAGKRIIKKIERELNKA
jgi:hypothetical protein